jgi:hypothetical protein
MEDKGRHNSIILLIAAHITEDNIEVAKSVRSNFSQISVPVQIHRESINQ